MDTFGFIALIFWAVVIGAVLKVAFWVWVGMHAVRAVQQIQYAYNQDFTRLMYDLSRAIQSHQNEFARQAELAAREQIRRLPPPQQQQHRNGLDAVVHGKMTVNDRGEWVPAS